MNRRDGWVLYLLIMVLAPFALLAPSAAAHETDAFTSPPGRQYADMGPYVSAWLYDHMVEGIAAENARIAVRVRNGATIADVTGEDSIDSIAISIFNAFPNAYATIEGFERTLHSPTFRSQYPGLQTGTKSALGQIYQEAHFPLDPRRVFKFWFASNLYVYGSYLGTDKIGHFLDMGKNYFMRYRSARRSGKDDAAARADAVRLGAESFLYGEKGVLGNFSAGAYSNADLASNYAGMLFYINLTEPVRVKGQMRPPMLIRDGAYWRLAPHVEPGSDYFEWFVSDHFDEALTPSLFGPTMRGGLRRAIGKRADGILFRFRDDLGFRRSPQFFATRMKELETYYGEDYGFDGNAQTLLSFDQVCFEPVPANAPATEFNPTGHNALHWAVAMGDIQVTRQLLDKGFDVNSRMKPQSNLALTEKGNTALHLAARDGNVAIVQLLLSRGALVNAANAVGVMPLHRAVGHANVVELLLKQGANIDARDAKGRTALHLAAIDPKASESVLLLTAANRADAKDNQGQTALHHAAKAGHIDAIATLLGYGAKVNAVDRLGMMPLHYAAEQGHAQAVTVLLRNGANASLADGFGYTALHAAARTGASDVIAALLSTQGVQVSATDATGTTALHLAARRRSHTSVQMLLNAGALRTAATQFGVTPAAEARAAGDAELAKKLELPNTAPATAVQFSR